MCRILFVLLCSIPKWPKDICHKVTLIALHLNWISDISQYFSYFLSLYLLNKETQHDTYLNPCSEFTLNFLDSIYSQMTPFCEQSFLLELEPLSSNYALFSNHDCGYADLSKPLWLCMSKRVGVFSHLFLYRFLLKYYIKIHKTLVIWLDTFPLNLLESYRRTRET